MPLEDLARRLGTVLGVTSLGVFLVAFLCATGGAEDAQPEIVTLHQLFGLTIAVLGLAMFAVGLALASVPRRSDT